MFFPLGRQRVQNGSDVVVCQSLDTECVEVNEEENKEEEEEEVEESDDEDYSLLTYIPHYGNFKAKVCLTSLQGVSS